MALGGKKLCIAVIDYQRLTVWRFPGEKKNHSASPEPRRDSGDDSDASSVASSSGGCDKDDDSINDGKPNSG